MLTLLLDSTPRYILKNYSKIEEITVILATHLRKTLPKVLRGTIPDKINA